MQKLINISLGSKVEQRKFSETTLDAYALKKYKTLYQDSKSKVNEDIRKLSVKYNTIIPKEITALIFAEMLPAKEKKVYLEKHF